MLNRSQQNFAHICYNMCKILLQSVEYILNQSTSDCGLILDWIEISLVGQRPCPYPIYVWDFLDSYFLPVKFIKSMSLHPEGSSDPGDVCSCVRGREEIC